MEPPTSQPPPIPRQHRHQSRQRALQHHAAPKPTADTRPRQGSVPSTSPEVISSLITSLSVISKPANNHFEGPAGLSAPASPAPGSGSFGVDYGAYSHASHDDDPGHSVSLDELAASSPVIRTSKPPSGFSPLTAQKSPARESGLKSMLRGASRPSSKGSLTSDAQSIGNLSVERGPAPQPELRKQRSHDSWGKKQGRNVKGLMYMTSKERLREKELERRRPSIGAGGASSEGLNSPTSVRTDPFMPITEEQTLESPKREESEKAASSMDLPSPRLIPARDSSLRKAGSSSAKRSSTRTSRSKRDGATSPSAIPEHDEHSRQDAPKHRSSQKKASEPTFNTNNTNVPIFDTSLPTRHHPDTTTHIPADDPEEEPAPFPSVAQGRRRDASFDRGRRRSGQLTPDPTDSARLKRSSSKLKRTSGPLSPPPDEKPEGRNRVSSPDPRGYERPPSADSIDDAVESYLCSPRLSQKIKHPQTGRVISFSEVGDSEGYAVICCVGMGLTRYITAFYDELALTLKLRLITPDRPGVGDSEPYPDGSVTPLSWPGELSPYNLHW